MLIHLSDVKQHQDQPSVFRSMTKVPASAGYPHDKKAEARETNTGFRSSQWRSIKFMLSGFKLVFTEFQSAGDLPLLTVCFIDFKILH